MEALPDTLFPLPRLVIVTGHYGTGKTNLSLNLAIDTASQGRKVTVVDLDLVNPYFRSSDYTELLERHGVRMVAPVFAGTTLDTPSISSEVYAAIEQARADVSPQQQAGAQPQQQGEPCVIIDVGGDDVGATALGRFRAVISSQPYEMLYVVNMYRNLAATPAEACELLKEIESASGLVATAVVNNSHLRDETTMQTVLDSRAFADECARQLGLPLVCTTIPDYLVQGKTADALADAAVQKAYPVKLHVRTPWEEAAE